MMRRLNFMDIRDLCPLLLSLPASLRCLCRRHWGWGVWNQKSGPHIFDNWKASFLQSWLPAGWYQGHSLCEIISHIALLLQSSSWRSVLNLKKKKKVQFSIGTKEMVRVLVHYISGAFLTVAHSCLFPEAPLCLPSWAFFLLDNYYCLLIWSFCL